MSFFISDALAEAGQAAQPSMLEGLLPLVFLFVIFYFLLIRPQSKRMKEHKSMVAALGKGDEVVITGGILGKITNVGEGFLTVEIADGVSVKVQKDMVASLMPKGTMKDA